MKSSPLRPCGWMKIERSGGWDENDSGWERGAGGWGLRWIRNMGPDAQINYSLHSSILSCQLPFIEAVRCPLRLARGGEVSCQEPRERKSSVKKHRKKTLVMGWIWVAAPICKSRTGIVPTQPWGIERRKASRVIARGPRARWHSFFNWQSWKPLKFFNTAM